MNYTLIDSILEVWADNHALHVQTEFKDFEVRSIDIVSPEGVRFQLWVDKPNQDGDTNVHVWDMRKRRKDFPTTLAVLENQLEAAYQQARNWF